MALLESPPVLCEWLISMCTTQPASWLLRVPAGDFQSSISSSASEPWAGLKPYFAPLMCDGWPNPAAASPCRRAGKAVLHGHGPAVAVPQCPRAGRGAAGARQGAHAEPGTPAP